jgi:hypothetical protein
MDKEFHMNLSKMKWSTVLCVALLISLTAFAPIFADSHSDAVSGASKLDPLWSIDLTGVRGVNLNAAWFEEAKSHTSHYGARDFERKGKMSTYMTMPLWMIVAIVDGYDSHHPFKFDKDTWVTGYDITVTSTDGYSATFNTAEVAHEEIFIADMQDGSPIKPMLVGNVTGKLWVRDIAQIECSLGGEAVIGPDPDFRLKIKANEEEKQFSLAELEESPYYVESTGSYTTSAGTTYEHVYGGVKFADLLQSFLPLKKDSTITIAAMDGYEVSYSGIEILDSSDGEWILAFKSDGEYLPIDPGFIRTVKVGENNPNIQGHSSARMVETISISGEPYREFSLEMAGLFNAVLDRQTIQTGISCHKTTVQYYDRKADEVIEYTGIPVWRLLGYSDDPEHAPHKQTDPSILSYKEETARNGYKVKIEASDGYSRTIDSKELNMNDDVIIAMYRQGEELSGDEWPLRLVWDKDAEIIPAEIKSVRQIVKITLLFE